MNNLSSLNLRMAYHKNRGWCGVCMCKSVSEQIHCIVLLDDQIKQELEREQARLWDLHMAYEY
jgi:hypothetical protein